MVVAGLAIYWDGLFGGELFLGILGEAIGDRIVRADRWSLPKGCDNEYLLSAENRWAGADAYLRSGT